MGWSASLWRKYVYGFLKITSPFRYYYVRFVREGGAWRSRKCQGIGFHLLWSWRASVMNNHYTHHYTPRVPLWPGGLFQAPPHDMPARRRTRHAHVAEISRARLESRHSQTPVEGGMASCKRKCASSITPHLAMTCALRYRSTTFPSAGDDSSSDHNCLAEMPVEYGISL